MLKSKKQHKKKTAKKVVKKRLHKPRKKIAKKAKTRVKAKKKVGKKPGAKKAGARLSESAILALIEKGKHRGFVTQSEVLNSFPEVEKDIKGLEMLYERLESSNIHIIESGRVFEEGKNKEYEEKKKIQDEFGEATSDSVQMYLKE